MHNKTTLIISSFIFASGMLFVIMPQVSRAEDAKTGGDFGGILELIRDVNKEASASATRGQKNLSEIIARADTLITNRINQLNSLITRIGNDKRLSDEEKTSLTTQVQTAITGLNTLKAKIDADTDATTAMADAKTIFTGYRIYEMLEPKISLLVMLNNAKTLATNIQTLLPNLQALIDTFGTQGKDVTQLNALMADMTTQVNNILTTVNADIATVEAINVNTSNPKTAFEQVRQDMLNTIKVDFGKMRTDITLMRPIFKGFMTPTSTSTPTATP